MNLSMAHLKVAGRFPCFGSALLLLWALTVFVERLIVWSRYYISISFFKLFFRTMLILYHLYNFHILFLQLRITVWSLCTKAVSYIKYPKACQKGEYDSDGVDFSVFRRLARGTCQEYLRTEASRESHAVLELVARAQLCGQTLAAFADSCVSLQ